MEMEHSRIFIKVIQAGSFTGAAEILKLPKSTVSRAIAKLEADTGTKLLIRTTRSLMMTEAGKEFYDACLPAVLKLEDAHKNLLGRDKKISGLIKLTAPEDLGLSVIAPAIAELSLKYPSLNFEFSFTDDVVDVVTNGFDIAIRLGKRKDSGLKLKQAGEIVLIAVASPKYLSSKKKIQHPSDLKDHTCLSHFWSKQWTMKSQNGVIKVPVRTKIVGNQMISMLKFAVLGCGIAFVPKYLCEPYLKSRDLIHVLPQWKSPPIITSIMTPVAPSSSAKLKLVVDVIYNAIAKAVR
jgi:LysR family transcriptional regulator for bpeEF and oprC